MNINLTAIEVDITRPMLDALKDAFSGTSYAKIALNVSKCTMTITCPLKKKVAGHRTVIKFEEDALRGLPEDCAINDVIMRLPYPQDAVSCMRIPQGDEKLTIAFCVKNLNESDAIASRMEVIDPVAGTFSFESVTEEAAKIWFEVKESAMNKQTSHSFKLTPDALWTISTLNKMSRSIDAYIIIAQPNKPAEIRVYSGLDDAKKATLSDAVRGKIISVIEGIPTINTMKIDAVSKDQEAIITILTQDRISILPFNKPAGTFSLNSVLVYYDTENERYVLPTKESL